MSILAICPSRGRPQAAHETLRSFLETRADKGSRVAFVVDSDDPLRDQYPKEYIYLVPPQGNMGAALRTAGSDQKLLADATSVGMIGDDNRFRSKGWDTTLDKWLTENIGIAYGDDGFQHARLPTSWWLSRAIVDEFGMTDPGLRHFYMDNWAKELGTGADCLRYFPNVDIEHLHPLAGKAQDDAIYRRALANERHDQMYFDYWIRKVRPGEIARLRAIIAAR